MYEKSKKSYKVLIMLISHIDLSNNIYLHQINKTKPIDHNNTKYKTILNLDLQFDVRI